MKHLIRTSAVIALILPAIIFSSCKKSSDDIIIPQPVQPAPAAEVYPSPISAMITQGMVDSIRIRGGAVYSGTTPPIVNGIYLMHPDSCTYDNSPSAFAGTLFTDYKFQFTAQNNSAFTVNVDQKAIPAGTLSPTPASVYISGSGNDFSIFILRTTTPGGITVQQFNVLSGTLTAGGIQNLKNTLYIRSKGADPGGTYPAAGTIRVFVNGAPGLATTQSTF